MMHDIRHILVVGSGTMGAGIAQVAAQAGYTVTLHDVDRARLESARDGIARFIGRAAEKGQTTAAEAHAAIARVSISDDLHEAATNADCAIEAIFEDFDVKAALWTRLRNVLPSHALAATNTSGLSVTRLADVFGDPARFVGLHFFNPVPLMRLLEVVRGDQTDPERLEQAVALGGRLGKTVVVCKDAPNFIVNRVNRAVSGEAQLLVMAGIPAQTVDTALRDGAGFRAGPLETGDASGLQIGLAVSQNIFDAMHGNPRYTPQPIICDLVAAGDTGRRAGRGFYIYEADGSQQPRTPDRLSRARAALAAPDYQSPTISEETEPHAVTSVGPLPFVQPDFYEVQYPDDIADDEIVALADAFAASGETAVFLPHTPEGIVRRCIAMLINEAAYAVADGLASPADIDTAMRLGMNYPLGPFEYLEKWGAANVVAVLASLRAATDNPRYDPAPSLRDLT